MWQTSTAPIIVLSHLAMLASLGLRFQEPKNQSINNEIYFKLYQASAAALKRVDTHLRIGGPVAGPGYLPDFLTYMQQHDVPVDFVEAYES